MKINCIACGHAFDLGAAYDDYEGLVRCNTCAGLLALRTQDGNVRSVLPGDAMLRQATSASVPEQQPSIRTQPMRAPAPAALTTDDARQAA